MKHIFALHAGSKTINGERPTQIIRPVPDWRL